MRVDYKTLEDNFNRVLIKHKMKKSDAAKVARMFALASADGVHTHGLNRFFRYVSMIDNKEIDLEKSISLVASLGAIEVYDGNLGPGNLNAIKATERAIELARTHHVGIVSLKNTNHWIRPGYYGLLAAEEGMAALMWTNTCANMPVWGSLEAKLGNNPVVIAIPQEEGMAPLLLDTAMSMFSYGKLEKFVMDGVSCPVDGGFDKDGNITRDPEKILSSRAPLPIGYWKGSGLSLALDMLAALLSSGRTVNMISPEPEIGLSQVFIVFDIKSLPDWRLSMERMKDALMDIKSSTPIDPNRPVRYPGEGLFSERKKSMAEGVYCNDELYKKLLDM